MALLSDTRQSILATVNEVRRKLKIPAVTSLSDDEHSVVLVDYLNDVLAYINDYDDWLEDRFSMTITLVEDVATYDVNPSGKSVKNIKQIYYGDGVSPLTLVDLDDLIRQSRNQGSGAPTQWSISGVDETYGVPEVMIWPAPSSPEAGEELTVHGIKKVRRYTTADGDIIPNYDAGLIVDMLLSLALLDESRGTSAQDYQMQLARFNDRITQTLNRYKGDSGTVVQMTVRR